MHMRRNGPLRYLCWFICMFISSQMMAVEAPTNHTEIDELFHRWESVLPEPGAYEDNGLCSGTKCPNHPVHSAGFLTISIANRVPVRKDSDLLALVKWAKHSDACIRAIAIGAIVKRIGFDRDEWVIGMEDPECEVYHHIMVALAQYLRLGKTDYDDSLFKGMFVSLGPDDANAFASGKWEEEAPLDYKWRGRLKFDGTSLLMEYLTNFKGQWLSDSQIIYKVETTETTTDQQLLITVSQQISPSKKVSFLIWPVSKEVMWFKPSNKFGTWKKFRRAE